LVLTASTFHAFSGKRTGFDRAQLWRHALASAMAGERAAKVLGLEMDDAFVCGLLHDIGKVVFDVLYPDEFERVVEQAQSGHRFIRDVECEIFGVNHAEIGGVLADHWNLPPALAGAIRWHHTPREASEHATEAHVTAVADFAAHQAALGESGNGCAAQAPQESFEALGITDVHLKTLEDELCTADERIGEILGILVI
ncbi:MAG TPA: HDOD domain-containing protein, partial [Candidatus Hydrogenedentes bacterium]|nr:HDOD domain-containing protein [Candidatus Hydrogenedentota bacterium]